MLHWWAHSWPLYSLHTPVASLHSVTQKLENLAKGPHTMVVLRLGAHIAAFTPFIFIW